MYRIPLRLETNHHLGVVANRVWFTPSLEGMYRKSRPRKRAFGMLLCCAPERPQQMFLFEATDYSFCIFLISPARIGAFCLTRKASGLCLACLCAGTWSVLPCCGGCRRRLRLSFDGLVA